MEHTSLILANSSTSHNPSALGFVLILHYRKVIVPAIAQLMQRTSREQPALLQQVLVLSIVPDMALSSHAELGICRKVKSKPS